MLEIQAVLCIMDAYLHIIAEDFSMVKTEIQLSEAQARALKALAAAQNKSTAELIRQVVDDFLRSMSGPDMEERKRRAIAAAGRFRSGLSGLSANHDRYLVEAYQG